jgi:hypothetical protein
VTRSYLINTLAVWQYHWHHDHHDASASALRLALPGWQVVLVLVLVLPVTVAGCRLYTVTSSTRSYFKLKNTVGFVCHGDSDWQSLALPVAVTLGLKLAESQAGPVCTGTGSGTVSSRY